MTKEILTFKYGTSRGVNTYGYRIVSLYVDGIKRFSTNGGGYDMRGTVLGQYIKKNYIDRLKKVKGNTGSLDDNIGYYGLSFYSSDNDRKNHKSYQEGDDIYLDGACGERCMISIAGAIDLKFEYHGTDTILVTDLSQDEIEARDNIPL